MAFFNDMDRLSLKLLSPSGLELLAKNIQEAFNNGHKYRKIEDCNGIVEYLKAIRDGEDGSEELFDKYIKVVDIGEKVTEKRCGNCKNYDIWPFEEPCLSCIASGDIRPRWKPKKDTSEQAKKNVNDIFGVDSIKHIEDRVESIQANVLEYGNNCVSKLIKLEEKVGLSPDAEIYLHDIRQDLCDLDTKLDGLESMLKDIQKSINDLPTISDISRIEDRIINMGKIESKIDELDGLNIKQFTVDEGPTEKELEEAHERLKKMTKSEPKFKVGDLVRLTSGTKIFEVVKVKEENYGGKTNYRYRLKSVDHGYFQYCPQSFLTRVAPPIFSKEDK